MLSPRRAGLAVLVALGMVLTAAPAPALAQATCYYRNGIRICENEQVDPGDGDGGGDDGGSQGGSQTCRYGDRVVPCSGEHGWYIGDGCYLAHADPQPGQAPPEGSDPDGSWYARTCPFIEGGEMNRTYVWRTAPEIGPDPGELARAIARVALRPPQIGIAPDPSGAGLVGLPVYLWTGTGPGVWGPTLDSASDGGVTVTIEATPVEVEWTMGDGNIVFCDNPGRPYDPAYAADPSPDCGHTYERPSLDQPDGRYRITAVTRWYVAYSSNTGVSGDFVTWTGAAETAVTIHELQVVTS